MAQLQFCKFQEVGYKNNNNKKNSSRFEDPSGAYPKVCNLVILAVRMGGLRKWLHSSLRERLRMPQFAGFSVLSNAGCLFCNLG